MTRNAGAYPYAMNRGGSGKGVHPSDVDARRHLVVVKGKEANRIKMRTRVDLLIGVHMNPYGLLPRDVPRDLGGSKASQTVKARHAYMWDKSPWVQFSDVSKAGKIIHMIGVT